jgi:NADH-quinone oxidoreductase subunit M
VISVLQIALIAFPALVTLLRRPLSRRLTLNCAALVMLFSCALPLLPQESLTTLKIGDSEVLGLDGLSQCLLPFTARVYLTILLFTPRAERLHGSSERLLLGLSLDLALVSVRTPMAIALVWLLGHIPLFTEVSNWPGGSGRLRLLRVLRFYLGLGGLLFVAGCWGLDQHAIGPSWAYIAITLGIVLRKAIIPFHQWLPELFERGPLGHVIAFCAPQVGAYASLRLLAPAAPQELLMALGAAALVTAVYGACLACGQRSFRGVYAGLFLGQTSLVFAGLQCTSEVGLTGALALWVSGGLALTGLGLTVWALEARRGRMNLDVYHGGYERSPMLATCFLLFGLTSCGFPGTLGFISEELLLEGTTHAHPHVGILAAVAASINGITVMRTYFRLFCGSRQHHPVSQSLRPRERMAVLALVAILLGCGLWPQPFVDNRAEFAKTVIHQRHQLLNR